MAELFDEHGDMARAIVSLINYGVASDIEEAVAYHEDNYKGHFESLEHVAEQDVDEGLFGEIPESIVNYIDYESIARDYDCGGDFITYEDDSGIHVWYSN